MVRHVSVDGRVVRRAVSGQYAFHTLYNPAKRTRGGFLASTHIFLSLRNGILTSHDQAEPTDHSNTPSSPPPCHKYVPHSQSSLNLSALATKLIFKFSLTPILTYLASHQKDIFWTSFGLALLLHKASLIYNSPKILEWWRACPAVLKKTEALDGAS